MPKVHSYRGVQTFNNATTAQKQFIAGLFDDYNMNAVQRKDFLFIRTRCRFTDELDWKQASAIITELKNKKEYDKNA